MNRAEKSESHPSTTLKKEYGYFIRTSWCKGKQKHTKTDIIPKSEAKISLGKVGDLEFYAYPAQYPDRVFIGLYPLSTAFVLQDLGKFLGMYNKMRTFLTNGYQNKAHTTKQGKVIRHSIERSINYHVKQLKKLKTG